MTDEEVRDWLVRHFDVSRETMARLEAFGAAVIAENERQNLISSATIPHIWSRHILDSAQLLRLGPKIDPSHPSWLDLGTGAGFPGMIIAILAELPLILVESRRKRFDFLVDQASSLGLTNVRVHCGRLETLETFPVGTISARAFAPLAKLYPPVFPPNRRAGCCQRAEVCAKNWNRSQVRGRVAFKWNPARLTPTPR